MLAPTIHSARFRTVALLCVALAAGASSRAVAQPAVEFQKGDRIVFVGNTFAERQQMFANFETMLTVELADLDLTFRNLGWSADTLTLKPRPRDFGTEDEHLHAQKADVIFACYGMNEAFAGPGGLDEYVADWEEFVTKVKAARYNRNRADTVVISKERVFPGITDDRKEDRPVRLVMVGPIAHERLGGKLPDPTAHNEQLARYNAAMAGIAKKHDVAFIDLYTPTMKWMADNPAVQLTINGIHLNAHGDWVVAHMMMNALGYEGAAAAASRAEREAAQAASLREAIVQKNDLWFYRWRAINGFYIYGGRKKPFGVENFPGEMVKLHQLIDAAEREIAELAAPLEGHYEAVPAPAAEKKS